MKNLQKGFIVPVLLAIIAVLVIGGGVYIYESKKTETPPVVNNQNQLPNQNQQQTNTQTPPVKTPANNPPSQTDTSFKVLSPKAGDSWKIGGVYSVKFQNLPKGSFVQGWLQDKNGANTGTASIGIIDTGRDGNPSSNIQITVPSQWCGGECGAVEYVTPGQYRLLLRIYPNVNNSSYQTFYSDYFTLTSNQTTSLPTSCVDQPETKAVITSLSSYSGPVGTSVEIRGCNFAGFEGDKNARIENTQGVIGILYGEQGSTAKVIKVTLKSPLCSQDNSYSGLPCSSYLTLTPGTYKIWTMPWGANTKSNLATFTIQ